MTLSMLSFEVDAPDIMPILSLSLNFTLLKSLVSLIKYEFAIC